MGNQRHQLTLPEFLAWEDTQSERHEFVGGEVFAMVGARRVHCEITTNLTGLLWNALRGSPCRVYAETRKLQVADELFYPDLAITCAAADTHGNEPMRSPTVIVEVLSPSTQAYDRSLKFAHYRRIESLREYVLVDPETLRVEVFRLGTEGWVLHDMSDRAVLTLASVGCELAMTAVFEGVERPGADSAS